MGFCRESKKNAENVETIMCYCKDCRNMSHHTFDIVYEHLVIKGMDMTYKIWYRHGDEVCVRDEIEDVYIFDEFNMCRSTYEREEVSDDPCLSSIENGLNQKVEDARIPLYLECVKFTKMSAIVALYKLKALSGWKNKSFSDLLE